MIVETDTKVLFLHADSVFSNWYPCKFEMRDIKFKNSEAAFMYLKAELFNDEESMEKIRKNQDPAEVKKLGRLVKGFDESIWVDARENALFIANSNKYFQNRPLMEILKATKEKILVEASPYDKIYGVGLKPDDPKALDEKNWLGLNIQGKTLMKVRSCID